MKGVGCVVLPTMHGAVMSRKVCTNNCRTTKWCGFLSACTASWRHLPSIQETVQALCRGHLGAPYLPHPLLCNAKRSLKASVQAAWGAGLAAGLERRGPGAGAGACAAAALLPFVLGQILGPNAKDPRILPSSHSPR